MSPALSFFTCSAFTADDDDFDFYNSSIASSLDRRDARRLKFLRLKKRKSTRFNMTISSPTNFRHDVHLGSELKADGSITLWDADRWRLELAKKDLILPPLAIPQQRSASASSTALTTSQASASKRNSFTPQKRKPVPSLLPPERPPRSFSPHKVPLPPSPALTPTELDSDLSDRATDFDGSEVPPLDPPSRGPSIDEGDEVLSLQRDDEKQMLSQWEHQPALDSKEAASRDCLTEAALLQA